MDRKFLIVLLVLPAILGLPLFGTAQQQSMDDCRESLAARQDSSGSEAPVVISMKDLQEAPQKYYGKTVTVEGDLHRRYTNNVFTIEGKTLTTAKDVLVVGTMDKAEAAVPTDPKHVRDVRVTGVVQPYDKAKLECAYGPLNIQGSENVSFTKNPVLIVDKTQSAKSETPTAPLAKPSTETTEPPTPEDEQ